MTAYTWNHLTCNGCGTVLTTSSTVNGQPIPGGSKTALSAGWKTKRATSTLPRRDYCPVCIKAGRA